MNNKNIKKKIKKEVEVEVIQLKKINKIKNYHQK